MSLRPSSGCGAFAIRDTMFGMTGTPSPVLSGKTIAIGWPFSIATLTSSVSVRPTLTSPRATRSRTTEFPSTTRTPFALSRRKKSSISRPPRRVERGDVERGRPEPRVGDRHLSLPFRIREVEDGLRGVFGPHRSRVVGDDAYPRREARPVPIGIDERRRDAFRARRAIRREHVSRLQHKRADGLVRPEDVGLRSRLLGEKPIGETGGFGFFGVVHRIDPHPGAPLVFAQHRLREYAIRRDVDGHRRASFAEAPAIAGRSPAMRRAMQIEPKRRDMHERHDLFGHDRQVVELRHRISLGPDPDFSRPG